MLFESLQQAKRIVVVQRKELVELFGFETRNKYSIETEEQKQIGFIAEQGKGFLKALGRYFLGHWRTFELSVFDSDRRELLKAVHPFRFYFKELLITTTDGKKFGALQERFAIFSRKFDFLDHTDRVCMTMSSSFFQFWTFPVFRRGNQVATIKKKWSGVLKEAFTDTDNFAIEFEHSSLTLEEKKLILVAAIFVDLQYFERKAQN